MASSNPPPSQLPVAELCARCELEVKDFHDRQLPTSQFCFEIARRALIENDAPAWECFYRHFQPLVKNWARRHRAFRADWDDVEDLAHESLANFLRQFTPQKKRWADFGSLPELLAYLKACVNSAVFNARRRDPKINETPLPALTPSSNPLELWAAIDKRLKNEAERLALRERFLYGLTPQAIARRHPSHFPNALAVSRIIANVLARLRRDGNFGAEFGDGNNAE